MKLRGFIAKFFRQELTESSLTDRQIGQRRPIPIVIPAEGRKISALTNAEIFEALDREDDEQHGRLPIKWGQADL